MSLFHDEEHHKGEPVKGLPDLLPDGERIIWQGRPRALTLAIHAMHIRAIAIYFGALMIWQAATAIRGGEAFGPAIASTLGLGVAATLAIGLLVIIARAMARATVYTITSARVVIRTGVALRKYINLPFTQISAVALKAQKTGHGDVAMETKKGAKLPYLYLWPHARPFKFGNPVPLLRSLEDAPEAAKTLVDAMQSHSPDTLSVVAHEKPASEPSTSAGARSPIAPSIPANA